MKQILHVAGARPNFMKVAPVMVALENQQGMNQTLVHTGQHYDISMSDVFFDHLGLPAPDYNLGVGSGSQAVQTAKIMIALERNLLGLRPDLVLVYGDVNSTLAAALVCSKIGMPFGHVEAGLRSFDRTMPEEINRMLTDQIADLLFTPSSDANQNLSQENVSNEKIHFVGNIMIDTLILSSPEAEARWPILTKKLPVGSDDLERGNYLLVTLHRPSNVDDLKRMSDIISTLQEISEKIPVLFPMHPRTKKQIEKTEFRSIGSQLFMINPMGYLDFLALQSHAKLLITDSGGVQEETTYLGVPCLTLRTSTERPVTVTMGTNTLVGDDMERLKLEVTHILENGGRKGRVPPLWDGKAGVRIANVIAQI